MGENSRLVTFDDSIPGNHLDSQTDIWRANALNILLLVAVVVFTPAIIVWFFRFQSLKDILDSAFVYFAIYLITVGLAVFRQIDFRLRAWFLIALTYLTGTQAMILGGLAGDGRIYLMILPIMALILIGARAGAFMSALAVITFIVLTFAASQGWLDDKLLFLDNPVDLATWTQEGIVMAACLALIVVLQWKFNQFLESTATKNSSLYEQIRTIATELEQRVVERTSELQNAYQKLHSREKKLRVAKAEAERANNAKSEFLSRMSHELRAPLNLVLGFAQLLEMDQQDPLSPAQLKSVRYILDEGEYLLGMIDEVLDISRIEAGHMDISEDVVDLRALVDELHSLTAPLAIQNQIRIELHPSIQEQINVYADQQRLHQVLLNLISNAIKFNRVGGSIIVSCERRDQQRMRIYVQDTGIGIEPDKIDDLFIPFVRLESEKSEVEGAGLGLALSKQLMGLMNGEIGVESTPGKGSNFWIELELADQLEGCLKVETQTDDPAAIVLPKSTLLYIEDYEANYELLQKALAEFPQVELQWARDGNTGLDLASQQPDLILLDLRLPDFHGHDVLKRLKHSDSTREIPVVVLSANATRHQIKYMLNAGAIAYITKPYKMRAMLKNIQTWLS